MKFAQSPTCPIGYLHVDGDYPGKGLGQYSASLGKCTHDCSVNMKCKAFEYSEKSSSGCKLLAKDTPINIQFKDFVFCRKEGNSLFQKIFTDECFILIYQKHIK